ncbi:histidine phosphatase family protein [Nocardia asteroides NBRC 15531]|uniref:Phosphoglycerate mutase n=1 Tax=Nocardia asteroides NBRC 15531 TaxID=1110697 RepID=U5EIH1_NOCAS|nr:histidine phosphatase family protein [Nocardia asteroides]TLF68985.1 histidine phosphatase family protein [Nocardia asteroides NBRC 15531]UGT48457.1 histidine phosphatase family protein [Nocardia asteroides]SFL60335.1 probable phosphoglycerate mutase [Nocardia asteroides]VEG32223.1 Alpha-ribazole phosphatase [Nocardia asteroides]GAD84964.1 putative phosphoglycerate mutase [Nocardia asteroides NBRC 15531]
MRTPAKLVLVRHGETEGNIAKILDTQVPGLPLTERGVAQAKAFGAALVRAPQVLVSSEALRARQTASYIEAATGTQAHVLDGLYEVQVGELHGRSDREAHEFFQKIYRGWHHGELDTRAPGGESGHEVLERIVPVLDGLREEFLTGDADGDVVVVNHGAAMRLVAMTLAGVAPPFTTNNHLDNTETIELVPTENGGWECLRWGRFLPPFTVKAAPSADDPMG